MHNLLGTVRRVHINRTSVAIISIVAVAGIGVAMLTLGHAAAPYASAEPEAGTITAPAATGSAAAASGGKYISFASPDTSSGTSYTPPGMRPLPDPLYGVTLDNVAFASTKTINGHLESLGALPHKPIARVVFDENTEPANYSQQIAQLQPSTYIMGELSDSLYMKQLSVQQFKDRATQFVQALGDKVDLWEVGNEVNGDWTGTYSDVGAKITGAYNAVKAAGKRTELTLWYDPNCGSSKEIDPLAFSKQYVPADMREGLDYVTISYYETECNNYRPSAATLTTLFKQLHDLYPNARLGFGEVGLPDYVTSATLAKAQSIAAYYYGLKIDLPYYVGGYFWWGFAEDGVPSSKPLWQTIADGMDQY